MIYLIDQNLDLGDHALKMAYIINEHCNATIEHVAVDNSTYLYELKMIFENLLEKVTSNDIILCPWCHPTNDFSLDYLIEDLSTKCYFVAAAGNNNIEIDKIFFPARVNNVYVAGAINKSGSKAQFSNFSKNKKIYWLPGTNYAINGKNETGTSVSSALLAAFIYEKNFKHDNLITLDEFISKRREYVHK